MALLTSAGVMRQVSCLSLSLKAVDLGSTPKYRHSFPVLSLCRGGVGTAIQKEVQIQRTE